jgi:alkylation response protein AidB-like acyl-CoA dehydrogenase
MQAAVTVAPSSVPTEEIAAAAAAVDRDGRFPEEAIGVLREHGLLALGIPEPKGGIGGGPVEYVSTVERIAGACASTAMVYVMHITATQTLIAGLEGRDGPPAAALAEIAAGEHLTTLAYSEKGSRGHFWAQVSRAARDNGGVTIDADKTYATSAGHARSYVTAVGAPGSEDPTTTELYLIPADAAGLDRPARFDGLGLRGNESGPLSLRGVRASDDQRLGEPGSGFGLMMSATLPWFALGSAASSVGIAGAALDAAADHAGRVRLEHLGGTTLAEMPTVRAQLAAAKVRHLQARAHLLEVARQVEAQDPAAELGVLAVKAGAAEMALAVTEAAMRVGGGAAYSRHLPIERHFRDARAASVMGPSTDVLYDFVGKVTTGQELF